MIFMLLVIWMSVFICWYFIEKRYVILHGRKFPGPKGYPILGCILMFWGRPEDIFRKMFKLAEEFPGLMVIWLGPILNVLVYEAKYLEIIFRTSGKIEKSDEYRYLRPWLGSSIIISSGATYKKHKRVIMPSFQTANLKQYVDIFNENSNLLVEAVGKHVGEEEFDVCPLLTTCTLANILGTSLGTKREVLGKDFDEYADAVGRLEKYVFMRIFNIWLRPALTFHFTRLKKVQDRNLSVLNGGTQDIIRERRKYQDYFGSNENNVSNLNYDHSALLDKYLKHNYDDLYEFTEDEIIDQVKGISFAGQGTTMVALGFALCLLGLHQDIQGRVMAELNEIFGDSARPSTYDDILQMQYLEQVLYETLRLYPSVPIIGKKINENIKLDKYVLPKGCTLAIPIMLLHRDPKQFPNPDKFNPGNFSPERVKERNRYSFIPFSTGIRKCVGQKYAVILMKVVLSTFLRHYRVYSQRKQENFQLTALITLKMNNGCLISIQPRNKVNEN